MKIMSVLVGVVIGLLVLSIVPGTVYGVHGNFSPQQLWVYKPKIDTTYDTTMGIQKTTIGSSIHYDVNGDGVPEVLVEIHNYTAKTYSVVLLSGADGTVLYRNKFTDIASTHYGNKIGIEASYYGITHVDSSGNVVSAYQYMIFTNYSDTHRISIYRLNEDLSNSSYGYIEIPSTISTPYGSATVSMYSAQISIMNYNYTNKEGLLFMGFYTGNLFGYFAMEVQTIMLDYNLNVVWERKEVALSRYSAFYPVGIEPTDLNGWGFNDGKTAYQGADVIMVNESSGNTVISGIEATDGQILWNVTLPGFVILGSPVGELGPYINFIDYDADHNVDMQVITYDYNANTTYMYFINSSGKVVARYNAGMGFRQIMESLPSYVNLTFMRRTQDLNNDTYGDAIFVNSNKILVAFDIEHNTTIYQKTLSSGYMYVPSLSESDINGDSVYDIYLYGSNHTTNSYWERVNLTAMDGASGSTLWNHTYNRVVGLAAAAFYPTDVSDLNGDGFGNEVIMQGYYSDGNGVYLNATVISLKNGSALYTIKVNSTINNVDYSNWTALCVLPGDVNGDGTNDMEIMMYYHTKNNSVPMDDSFIRFYDGMSGTLLWRGEVYEDHTLTKTTRMMWNPHTFGYELRANGEGNTILITTGDSVQAYEINSAVPELSFGVLVPLLAVAVILYLRRK
ncbi:hypothetical protein AciM339_0501 [Aciduliprofundum sp. MAR08-339]|uniref:hypothetical protein n=1 Tax=Aciduliprofundum sp. (strain MAR08-339) TaxID=673860 RepID=UPI0002A4AA1D|nr:hypothetical protein AciM339_0501 [Aciduliprofundum sp. MAR08-339]